MDLPIELIIYVFGHLAPPDVLSLAATCRKHRDIWQHHTNTIYKLINHAIQCERDARRLLADQGILPGDSAMTVPGFLQLRRNAHVIERITQRFGPEFVVPFCCTQTDSQYYGFYGGGPRPPYLTPTERPRYVRVVYRLWGLLLLGSAEARHQRLKCYKMKDLLSLQDIGPGYGIPPVDIMASVIMAEEKHPSAIGLTIPKIDRNIYFEALKEIQVEVGHVAQRAYGLSYLDFCSWNEGGWYRGLISLVDDCHLMFKDIVLNAENPDGKLFVPVDEVWYDTSDGEVMD